jgi:hypothetical protein
MLWNLLYVLGNLFRVSNMISCVALRPHGAPGHACFITSTYEPHGALGHARCRPPRQLEQISLEANTRCNTNFSRVFESVALHVQENYRGLCGSCGFVAARETRRALHTEPQPAEAEPSVCGPSISRRSTTARAPPSSPSAVHLCRR